MNSKQQLNNGKLYFKNLDSIRFIAALMVYLGHGLSSSYHYLPLKNTIFENLLYAISDGRTGVSIFFVLSGFLITYLLMTEHDMNSKISLRNFYIRRALRIWPLYYLIILFSFLFYPFLKQLADANYQSSGFFHNLIFLSNFEVIHLLSSCARCEVPMPQNINWSVSIEEQFYLFWPLVFVFIPKRFWIHSILIVLAWALLFRILNYENVYVLYFHTFSAFLHLGAGGLMACLIKEHPGARLFFENSSTFTHLLLFILLFCLVIWNKELFTFKYGEAIGQMFIAFSFAFIISAQAITTSASKLNLQNLSFAAKWGKYTYGIYLIHPITIACMDVLAYILHVPKTNFISLCVIWILGFLLTLFLSKISYDYYESRFLRLKDGFSAIKTRE